MSELWSKIGGIITKFLIWAIENHPGKLIGTSLGLVLGLLMVTLGLWRTLILALFVILGFALGKRQDDNKTITNWLEKNYRKY